MRRHVLTPSRWVSVEDGTVRDLDGNELGWVAQDKCTQGDPWAYSPMADAGGSYGPYRTQRAAVAALVADPSSFLLLGPNCFDKP